MKNTPFAKGAIFIANLELIELPPGAFRPGRSGRTGKMQVKARNGQVKSQNFVLAKRTERLPSCAVGKTEYAQEMMALLAKFRG